VQYLDPGHHLEQFAEDVRWAATAGRRHIALPGLALA
jgi:hypothetical protein